MKKALTFLFATAACMSVPTAQAAVSVKKASPVATQTTGGTAGVASLVPSVLSLVSGVQQLNAKQKELTAECVPSSAEISFVDGIIKEWAKTGAMGADDVRSSLGRRPCPGGRGYEAAVRMAAGTEMDDICFDNYASDSDVQMVWYQFPKVGNATYCADGSSSCSAKNKRNVSDMYEIFNLVDFSTADYTKKEAEVAAKIISKIETCSNAKLSAKKREMWGEFIVNTVGTVGKPTSTDTIMQSVSGVVGSGGGLGGLSSLGAIASQFLDK